MSPCHHGIMLQWNIHITLHVYIQILSWLLKITWSCPLSIQDIRRKYVVMPIFIVWERKDVTYYFLEVSGRHLSGRPISVVCCFENKKKTACGYMNMINCGLRHQLFLNLIFPFLSRGENINVVDRSSECSAAGWAHLPVRNGVALMYKLYCYIPDQIVFLQTTVPAGCQF